MRATPSTLRETCVAALLISLGAFACTGDQPGDDDPNTETGESQGDGDPGDGDGDPGDGDGDPGDGDGDGDGDGAGPKLVPLASTLRSCAITGDGEAKCWGWGRDGQLGDGMSGEGHSQLSPTLIAGVSDAVIDICGGGFHSCIVTELGAALCFGTAYEGALGTGVLGELLEPTPVPVVGLPDAAVQIDCGSNFTCARTESGEAWCWGNGASGRLGVNSTDDTATPLQTLPSDVTDISTGSDHACAVAAGEVWCWGSNINWQLGDPDPGTGSLVAIPVPGIPKGMLDVEVGSSTSCAIDGDGGVWCWGANDEGQVGIGSDNEQIFTATQLELPGPAISLSVGYLFACAVIDSGAVRCWGLGDVGQLGDGQSGTGYEANVPVAVDGLESGAHRVSVGRTHACAAMNDGRMLCWGSGSNAELGDGNASDGHLSAVPVEVMGL